jgi:guanylate kinase
MTLRLFLEWASYNRGSYYTDREEDDEKKKEEDLWWYLQVLYVKLVFFYIPQWVIGVMMMRRLIADQKTWKKKTQRNSNR